MLDARPHFAWDVLDESAPQKNVEALDSEADAEDGLLLSESILEQREVGVVAVVIGLGCLGVPRGVK
jgi:hypothetical protein